MIAESTDRLSTAPVAFCPMCDADNLPTGTLGHVDRYNCRACGMDYRSDTCEMIAEALTEVARAATVTAPEFVGGCYRTVTQ